MTLPTLHIAEIRHTYLFGRLNDAELDRIAAHASLLDLPAGKTLFAQDDPCRHFYYVRSGMVKLFRISPGGSEKVMELAGPGQTFAEAVMFSGKYPTHAVALDETRLIAFDCKDFRSQLHDNIDMCFRLMDNMSVRLYGLIDEIDQITQHSGTERLVRYLLDQIPADSHPSPSIRLPVPKQVIASRLNIKPETFSRALAKLRRLGLIEVHDDTILLKDAAMLSRMAS